MPDGRVVDTDVISYLYRGDTRVHVFRPYLEGQPLAVCFMTVAEIDRWALQRNWGAQRLEQMAAFLERFAIVLADRTLCRTWAMVADGARRKGRPSHTADAWIAAAALAPGVPLVTNNRDDYAGVDGLQLLPCPVTRRKAPTWTTVSIAATSISACCIAASVASCVMVSGTAPWAGAADPRNVR